MLKMTDSSDFRDYPKRPGNGELSQEIADFLSFGIPSGNMAMQKIQENVRFSQVFVVARPPCCELVASFKASRHEERSSAPAQFGSAL